MNNGLRKSGIELVGGVPWGTHLCMFYLTRADLLELLVPYFRAGLENNEFCMWVTSEPLSVEDADQALRQAVGDYDKKKASGQIEIVPYTDWYLKDGYFDLHRVFAGWIAKLENALKQGFDGLRTTGNTAWLESADWTGFTEYEEELDKIIGDYRMMAVCTYSLDKCGASEVIDVVKNHEYAIIEREGAWELIESAHRKRAREELAAMSEQLLRVNKELDGYAHMVSHDLRGPLAAVTLATEALSDSLEEADFESLRVEVSESASMIRRNTDKCFNLINDLLALAEAGHTPIEVSPIDVASVVAEILEENAFEVAAKGFEVLVDDDMGTVRGNRTQIYQVFSNLIANAVRHGDSSEPVIEVRLLGQEDGLHRYLVKDNGPGIPPEYAEDIFRPFFRWGRGSYTGVGLSIVKKNVAAYGGEITTCNEGGACFEFTIRDAVEAASSD